MPQQDPEMRTAHPHEMLRQLTGFVAGYDDQLSVTVPARTTVRTALQAIEATLPDTEESIFLMP